MKKIVTFGELMLRLRPPDHEKFFQSPTLEATFGGSEANVAVGLARFGLKSYFVSILPDNDIGDAAIGELRRYGVDISLIKRKEGRIGIYFLETGANQRSSKVIYDRKYSSFYNIENGDIDWGKIFDNDTWFHISGITPAISRKLADETIRAIDIAREKGAIISCDLNYRKKLWDYGVSSVEVMSKIVSKIDYVIANEEDVQMTLGIDVNGIDIEGERIEKDRYRKLTDIVLDEYRNIKKIAITIRESFSADYSGWSSVLNNRKEFFISKRYNIRDIIDRVGAGDAFAAGLIYGLNNFKRDNEALEFATAASCLKHSIPGDLPLLYLEEVINLMRSAGSGRIQR
ncbi:MAG: sugar kinase [Spirochaetes bacterium]|nr:MAG: sugar kinase [Spirochaetota bacterium]